MIGKSKSLRCFKSVNSENLSVLWYAKLKVWITAYFLKMGRHNKETDEAKQEKNSSDYR